MPFGRIFCAALLLLLACPPARAGDGAFRLLTLNGGYVRWFPRAGDKAPIVRFAIATAELHTPGAINCGAMAAPDGLLRNSGLGRAAFREAVAAAFARWQAAIAVDFVEVASAAEADIVIGEQLVAAGFAFTNITTDTGAATATAANGTPVRAIDKALICLNPQRRWKVGFDGDLAVYDVTHTIAHEIGHALGLDHPADRNALMSFRYHEQVPTLTAGDARGAIAIYGARAKPSATIASGPAASERSIAGLD